MREIARHGSVALNVLDDALADEREDDWFRAATLIDAVAGFGQDGVDVLSRAAASGSDMVQSVAQEVLNDKSEVAGVTSA